MRDETVYVGNVGSDDSGTYLDVRCGDAPLRVGQSLWAERAGSRLVVTVDRIEVYGRDFNVLDPGLTARVWVSPGGVAGFFADGTRLHPGEHRRQ